MTVLRLGTRGSALARWQAEHVRGLLKRAHAEVEVRIEMIRTRGDEHTGATADRPEGTGVFTREIERALLDGTVDVAVHSLKDLPTESPDGLVVAAIPAREDPADVLIAAGGGTLSALPAGATVLTGSPRRAAQVLHYRGDLVIASIRGNVDTRLRRFDHSDAAGLVLARAGLVRLGLAGRITERLDPTSFLPAPGQGALAVQARADDGPTTALLAAIGDPASGAAVAAERAFLAELGGGCRVPAGAYGRFDDSGTLRLTAMVASPDGRRLIQHSAAAADGADPVAAVALGQHLAATILADGGAEILHEASA